MNPVLNPLRWRRGYLAVVNYASKAARTASLRFSPTRVGWRRHYIDLHTGDVITKADRNAVLRAVQKKAFEKFRRVGL